MYQYPVIKAFHKQLLQKALVMKKKFEEILASKKFCVISLQVKKTLHQNTY